MPRILACLLIVCAAPALTAHEADRALTSALERLALTGEPWTTAYGEGQWIQVAVLEALKAGDPELEKLAARAAFPLVSRISRPVTSTDDPGMVDVGARKVLELPRTVSFKAHISVSHNGGEMLAVGTAMNERGWGGSVRDVLPAAARLPGYHHLRIRASIEYAIGKDGPRWTEVRDLPDVTYALYDPIAVTAGGPAPLLLSPATASAHAFDPDLPDVRFATWLDQLLQQHGTDTQDKKKKVAWLSHYCVEMRQSVRWPTRDGDVCAVAYFETRGDIFRAWFRTGTIRFVESGPEWSTRAPELLGINTSHSGTALTRLGSLPPLLASSKESWPVGDVAIAPEDIDVSPPDPARGYRSTVTITVRNNGPVALYGVEVSFGATADPSARGIMRAAVVDVPALGSADVRFDTSFPHGFGFALAHAIQLSAASPDDAFTFDPTPEDGCAFRIVNAHAAPPNYKRMLGDTSGCRGW